MYTPEPKVYALPHIANGWMLGKPLCKWYEQGTTTEWNGKWNVFDYRWHFQKVKLWKSNNHLQAVLDSFSFSSSSSASIHLFPFILLYLLASLHLSIYLSSSSSLHICVPPLITSWLWYYIQKIHVHSEPAMVMRCWTHYYGAFVVSKPHTWPNGVQIMRMAMTLFWPLDGWECHNAFVWCMLYSVCCIHMRVRVRTEPVSSYTHTSDLFEISVNVNEITFSWKMANQWITTRNTVCVRCFIMFA